MRTLIPQKIIRGAARAALTLLLTAVVWPHSACAAGEESFASPDEAVNALVAAGKSSANDAFAPLFGPEGRDLVSPDAVQASNSLVNFKRRLAEKVVLITNSEANLTLQIGFDSWPFPIPLLRQDGQWHFDTAAGKEEILNRRVGMDELAAIRVCQSYVDAQREYASEPRDGAGFVQYAQRLRSTPGRHDGLYWHADAGDEISPFGPLIAQSHEEGYHQTNRIMGENLAPYRGYRFKILTRQGPHAPAGKFSYIINGHMIAGFALVAWPAEWGNTGIMTFIVNQEGIVYQKDLGAKTARLAAAMSQYDPDATWQPAMSQ